MLGDPNYEEVVEFMKLYLKLIMLFIIVMSFCIQRSVYASGVPFYQYDQINVGLVNGVYVDSSRYDWKSGEYYYKVITNIYPPSGYRYGYGSTCSLKGSHSAGYGSGGTYLEGYNGSTWEYIAHLANQGWSFDVNVTFGPQSSYTQLRIVSYTTGLGCIILNSDRIPVFLVGADQNTVEDAINAANNASVHAMNASTNAANAKSSADAAAARVWDSTEGKSAATLAKEARNNASAAANQTIYNGQSAAYWSYLAAQSTAPQINKVQGLNGATCTSGSTFTVVISATPGSGVNYRVTCGSFDSGWVTSNAITISSGIVSGANTATVQVKNAAGAVAQATFTFFKV